MNKQIYVIDPVVYVDKYGTVQPVNGIFDSLVSVVGKVGSGIAKGLGSVATKFGSLIKSPVVGKLLEGGVAIGGSLLLGQQAAKQQKAQLQAQQKAEAEAMAAMQAQAQAQAQSTSAGGMNTKTILLYGGAAVLAVAGIYLLARRRR
jgi:hypothetical protein